MSRTNKLETEVGTFGPEDVDAAGDLAPKIVKQQQAHELIEKVRASYPVELVTLQQRDEDRGRTKALDADEVLEATREAFGEADEPGGVVRVLSARVRGKVQPVGEKAVVVLWETPSKRTARGAFAYAPLTRSLDAFDRLSAAGEIVEVDETDAKDLTRTVERQREQISRLNARLASGEAGDPTEGTGLTKEDVAEMIRDAVGDGAEALDELQGSLEEKDARIAELEAQLEGRDPGSPGPQEKQPESTDPGSEDAADGTGDGSKTEAEAEAAAAAAGQQAEQVEAPKGKQQELLDAMDSYSAEQLDALLEAEKGASRPRPKVIEAAEAARKKLADAAEG